VLRPCSGAGGALLEDEPRLDVTDAQVVDLIEASIKLMDAAPAVKEYALTAALKLTARLPGQQARLQALIAKHRDSVMLEVQQRSCEYQQLFKHDRIRPQLLERMPALDESTYAPSMAAAVSSTSRGGSAGGAATSGGGAAPAAAQDDLVDLLGGTAPAAAAAPQAAVDALDELLGGISAPASGGPSSTPSAAAGDLLDMLGGAPAPVPASQSSLPAADVSTGCAQPQPCPG
jgi:AP-1 complex subunit gamma-1